MMKPLAGRIIVQPTSEEQSDFSFANEKQNTSKVIAVGIKKGDEEIEVSEGDTIIHSSFSGTPVTIDEVDYLIMRHSDILVVL